MEDLDKRIQEANDEMVTEVNKTDEVVSSNQPTDLLQTQRDARRNVDVRGARGSRPKAKLDLSALTATGIRDQYNRVKDDSDYYTSIGNKQYASMVKQQYMEDYFLPTIDALVKLNGMGAIQANQDLLREMDALTLLDGTNGAGYTATYLSSMYVPEGQIERSDAQVREAMKEINALCLDDQISSAVGRANDIKRRIDKGENMASADDYEILQRVALYGQ